MTPSLIEALLVNVTGEASSVIGISEMLEEDIRDDVQSDEATADLQTIIEAAKRVIRYVHVYATETAPKPVVPLLPPISKTLVDEPVAVHLSPHSARGIGSNGSSGSGRLRASSLTRSESVIEDMSNKKGRSVIARLQKTISPVATSRKLSLSSSGDLQKWFKQLRTSMEFDQSLISNMIATPFSRGSHSVLYAGLYDNEPCVIKEFLFEGTDADRIAAIREFKVELATLLLLRNRSPHVCGIYGAMFAPTASIVMPYYSNGTLTEKLRGEAVSDGQKVTWIRQLLAALSCMHSIEPPLIHCDIKSHNVMLDANDNIVLIDFGGVVSPQHVHSFSGTPRWADPERLEGSIGTKSDIYSAGVVLWEMATNCADPYPYPSIKFDYEVEIAIKEGSTQLEFPITASNSILRRLAMRFMRRDPHLRPSAADALTFLDFYDTDSD